MYFERCFPDTICPRSLFTCGRTVVNLLASKLQQLPLHEAIIVVALNGSRNWLSIHAMQSAAPSDEICDSVAKFNDIVVVPAIDS